MHLAPKYKPGLYFYYFIHYLKRNNLPAYQKKVQIKSTPSDLLKNSQNLQKPKQLNPLE